MKGGRRKKRRTREKWANVAEERAEVRKGETGKEKRGEREDQEETENPWKEGEVLRAVKLLHARPSLLPGSPSRSVRRKCRAAASAECCPEGRKRTPPPPLGSPAVQKAAVNACILILNVHRCLVISDG